MNRVVLFLAIILLASALARARIGDELARSLWRYGQPVAQTGQPGHLTSTKTFIASGLQVTCGYVKGIVQMITYTNGTRSFMPAETEALLRTNARKQTWTPSMGFGNGTYHSTSGVTAQVKNNTVKLFTPVWTAAVAKDLAADQAAAKGDTNAVPAANPNSAPAAGTP